MDHYTDAFYSVVKETQSTTGLTLPHHIEAYVVMLLASKVDKPDFLPKGTFAENHNLGEYASSEQSQFCWLKINTLSLSSKKLIISWLTSFNKFEIPVSFLRSNIP